MKNNNNNNNIRYMVNGLLTYSNDGKNLITEDIYDSRIKSQIFKNYDDALNFCKKNIEKITVKYNYNGIFFQHYGYIIDSVEVNSDNEVISYLNQEIFYDEYQE